MAAIALIRRVAWGRPAVLAIGATNAAGGLLAMFSGWEGGVVDLVLGLAAVGLSLVPTERPAL